MAQVNAATTQLLELEKYARENFPHNFAKLPPFQSEVIRHEKTGDRTLRFENQFYVTMTSGGRMLYSELLLERVEPFCWLVPRDPSEFPSHLPAFPRYCFLKQGFEGQSLRASFS